MPELSRVVLETGTDSLTLVATDLRLGIRQTIAATVTEPGTTSVAARIVELTDSLPAGEVAMQLDRTRSRLQLVVQGYSCDVRSFSVDDFPTKVPAGHVDYVVEIEAGLLKHAIQEVAYIARRDEARPALGGVLLEVGPSIQLTATDNYRLAVRNVVAEATSRLAVLVPAESLNEVERVLEGSSRAKVLIGTTTGQRQVLFTVAQTVLVSGLIAGQFPDVTAIEKIEFDTTVRVGRSPLLRAVQVAGYFAGSRGLRLEVLVSSNLLRVSARHPEEGQTHLDVAIDGSGADVAVDMHAGNLGEVLQRLNTDEVEVRFSDSKYIGVFAYGGAYRQFMTPLTITTPQLERANLGRREQDLG